MIFMILLSTIAHQHFGVEELSTLESYSFTVKLTVTW